LFPSGPRQQNSEVVRRRITALAESDLARPLRPFPPGTEVYLGSTSQRHPADCVACGDSVQFPGRWQAQTCVVGERWMRVARIRSCLPPFGVGPGATRVRQLLRTPSNMHLLLQARLRGRVYNRAAR
jgi:hypothetical protein